MTNTEWIYNIDSNPPKELELVWFATQHKVFLGYLRGSFFKCANKDGAYQIQDVVAYMYPEKPKLPLPRICTTCKHLVNINPNQQYACMASYSSEHGTIDEIHPDDIQNCPQWKPGRSSTTQKTLRSILRESLNSLYLNQIFEINLDDGELHLLMAGYEVDLDVAPKHYVK